MGTLIIGFTGANVYIPHRDGTSLMVVSPNGTQLGSTKPARDGTPMKPHWPVLYERIDRDRLIIPHPFHFAGARLTFEFTPRKDEGDFRGLTTPTAAFDWLAADTEVIANPDKRVAALIRLAAGIGRAIRPGGGCEMRLSPGRSGWSTDRIVSGIEVIIKDVSQVEVHRAPLVGTSPPPSILYRRSLTSRETATFVLGNLCAGKVLEQAEDPGTKLDEDFKWVYELSTSDTVRQILAGREPLPRPRVKIGGASAASKSRNIRKPEGIDSLVGCECSGYLAPFAGFT